MVQEEPGPVAYLSSSVSIYYCLMVAIVAAPVIMATITVVVSLSISPPVIFTFLELTLSSKEVPGMLYYKNNESLQF